MPFINSGQLRTELAANLKVDVATLAEAQWDEIINTSVKAARDDIVGALVSRGYTVAQIATWDRLAEFQTHIGLFWCLVNGAGLHGNDATFIDKLDRRAELASVAVLAGDVPIELEEDAVGEVGYGNLDETNDRFTMDTSW